MAAIAARKKDPTSWFALPAPVPYERIVKTARQCGKTRTFINTFSEESLERLHQMLAKASPAPEPTEPKPRVPAILQLRLFPDD